MTAFSFTNNVSAVVNFSGIVKIKCDDLAQGQQVVLQEERVDGTYENVGDWGVIQYPMRSATFQLAGNYKVIRSASTIGVGYEIG